MSTHECVHVVNECVHDMNECVHVVNEHVHVVNECVHVVAHKVTMKVTVKVTEKETMKNASGGAGVASLPCQSNFFSNRGMSLLLSCKQVHDLLLSCPWEGRGISSYVGNRGRPRSCGEHTLSGFGVSL